MQTSQYEIARYFFMFDQLLMMSPHIIPPTVFSKERRIFFFSPKNLSIAYKLTFQDSKMVAEMIVKRQNKVKPSSN